MDDEDRYTRITLRIPKDLHGVLTAEADRTSKSLNAQIVESLTYGFESAARLEKLKDTLIKFELQVAIAQDEAEVARRQAERHKAEIARLEKLEEQRIDGERISRLLMRLMTQGLRTLLKSPSPKTLADPDVALARALVHKIDAGGVGVAAMLAEIAPEDPSLHQLLKSIAVEESEMNSPPNAAPGPVNEHQTKRQRAGSQTKSSLTKPKP
ncbi:toxin-antitoxin system HicB family antitoxin [Acidovorax sp. LjRoot74]|uniref:toxin-antitoxin system HicB family antitoxin n=1 Tax=Acidovorax sp. LjRoot74 TaxID=3342337 RepID=UPI003ECF105A